MHMNVISFILYSESRKNSDVHELVNECANKDISVQWSIMEQGTKTQKILENTMLSD